MTELSERLRAIKFQLDGLPEGIYRNLPEDLYALMNEIETRLTAAQAVPDGRDAALEEAAFKPITMQDVRLCVGEGPLKADEVLAAVNTVLRQRLNHHSAIRALKSAPTNETPHAGEGPVPSTLAANLSACPSASRRGEPAPSHRKEGKADTAKSLHPGHHGSDNTQPPSSMSTAAEAALLPCPFCGSNPKWFVSELDPFGPAYLGCNSESCFGPRTTATGADTIAQWNARAPSPPAPGGWQTMETAPRDGTYVLCASRPLSGEWCFDVGRHCSNNIWVNEQFSTVPSPTHWMPLPAPPATPQPPVSERETG